MKKKVLVTAGSTKVEIDKVRAITNIFGGKTGTVIAERFSQSGYDVTLVTSNMLLAQALKNHVRVVAYKTFDDLNNAMEGEIRNGDYDIIIHSAAVSDYKCAGVFYEEDGKLVALDNDKKVSSKHQELFLKLVPTEKIVDKIRSEWGFEGTLVKFKLEVGVCDENLIEIARKSRVFSKADIIVANCLEWSNTFAYIVDGNLDVAKILREELPDALMNKINGRRVSL